MLYLYIPILVKTVVSLSSSDDAVCSREIFQIFKVENQVFAKLGVTTSVLIFWLNKLLLPLLNSYVRCTANMMCHDSGTTHETT